jgi:3-oxoacyl-[acyl-carrier protein] reductase
MTKPSQRVLQGKTALVTGAGSGIGRAIALELSALGAHVFAVGRNREHLASTCDAIAKAGGKAELIAADITTEDGLSALERATLRADVLVNNAAAWAPKGPLEGLTLEDLRRVHETIVIAPTCLCAAVLPAMKERKFGRIVNIGSIAAATGAEGQVAYSSAKSALYGLTRSVALESARCGVTCNLIDLGLIATERVKETMPADTQRSFIANTPLQRAGTVEEVAGTVAFLVSPAAGFITGAVIPVSGGLELGLFPRAQPEP